MNIFLAAGDSEIAKMCGGADVLGAIKFAMTILDAVFIIIPIIVILLTVIDFSKNVIAKEEGDMKKNLSLAIKRIIMCIALFLIVPSTHAIIKVVGENSKNFITCIKVATTEDITKYSLSSLLESGNSIQAETKETTKNQYKPGTKTEETDDNDDTDNNSSSGDSSSSSENGDNSGSQDTSQAVNKYDISSKSNQVAIMYSTWFDAILSTGTPGIISENRYTASTGKYYCWGKPSSGFYKSSNKSIIKKHMKQLADAGIDFIIIDNTNLVPGNGFTPKAPNWESHVTSSMTALLDTIAEMKSKGEKAPYVVNWVYTGHLYFITWQSVDNIYNQFYTKDKYKNCWVYWNDKPFIITTSTPTSSSSKSITTRSMWGLNGTSSVNWSFLERDNDKPGRDSSGNVEQIGVSTAAQATYMSNKSTALGRRNGLTFYEQWQTAFKYHPKVVTITWWNEWCAINQGNNTYVDLYDQDYSRDIEPMQGGHGDTYYKWMKQYISAYKSNKSCPKLTK